MPLEPPAPYRLWWALAEQCSGAIGSFESVRWFVVPGAREVSVSGEAHQGYWFAEGNRVVLAGGSVLSGPLVRHEMLHALLGAADHPARYFGERCGGLLACEGACAAELPPRPRPGPDAPILYVGELEVSAAVFPAAPSMSEGGGWVTLVTTAANLRPEAVWVRLKPVAPGHPAAATFGWVLGGSSGYAFVRDTLVAFGPGETRRGSRDEALRAGTYTAFGYFNADTAAVPLTVAP